MTTIASAIERIIAGMPERIAASAVDTVKQGELHHPLTGVVVSFMATRTVIGIAAASRANLIITHEPTFYNHLDETAWLDADPVYHDKKRYLAEHHLVVWRLHDHLHRGWPDLIAAGVLHQLGWEKRIDASRPGVVVLDQQHLAAVIQHLKTRLEIRQLKVVGSPTDRCSRIGLLPGAAGGRRQIALLSQNDIDTLICGESPEWETCEYVRDARAAGLNKSLVVLGHANSEEAGMAALATHIRPWLPADIPITHVPAGDPFLFM